MSREAPSFFAASLNQLCGGTLPLSNPQDPTAWVEVLDTIGRDPKKQSLVQNALHSTRLTKYEKLGTEWKSTIQELRAVFTKDRMPRLHWSVAVGALFYLLNPYDLIPDFVPFAGFLDDMATLEAARLYYRRWFSQSQQP